MGISETPFRPYVASEGELRRRLETAAIARCLILWQVAFQWLKGFLRNRLKSSGGELQGKEVAGHVSCVLMLLLLPYAVVKYTKRSSSSVVVGISICVLDEALRLSFNGLAL